MAKQWIRHQQARNSKERDFLLCVKLLMILQPIWPFCNIFANDFNEPVEFIQMNTFDKILTSKRILSFKVHFLRKK